MTKLKGLLIKRRLLNEQDNQLARGYSQFRKKWF